MTNVTKITDVIVNLKFFRRLQTFEDICTHIEGGIHFLSHKQKIILSQTVDSSLTELRIYFGQRLQNVLQFFSVKHRKVSLATLISVRKSLDFFTLVITKPLSLILVIV